MRFLDLIAKKRDGGAHTTEELNFIAQAAADGSAPDYQLAAWLMAVVCRGMNEMETAAWTRAMVDTGQTLDFASSGRSIADKHSTGGVGDGVSLILAPLVAACGLSVPMMSGRGLAHTGGTLDKLESIRGMQVQLAVPEIRRQISKIGLCLFGQTRQLAPADRTLYALRDATATVPCLPLIVGSILSKKIAEGLDVLVLDVKVGSGAIFQQRRSARELAQAMVKTAQREGISCTALLTSMEQPLGRNIGNALEVRQAIEILRGGAAPVDFMECTLALGGEMLRLSGVEVSARAGAEKLLTKLRDGSGLELLRRCIAAQGGDVRMIDDLERLPKAKKSRRLRSPQSGAVARLDAKLVGQAAVALGAGRDTKEQMLDLGAGLELLKKVGDRVVRGEDIAVLHAADNQRLDGGEALYWDALTITPRAARPKSVVLEIVA